MAAGETDVDSGRWRSEVGIVRAMFEAFARRDVESALERVHPRMQLSVHSTAALAGRTGPYRGHAGMRQYFADVDALWDELTILPGDYRAVAGAVVVFGRVRGRRAGQEVDTAAIWTWRVSEGLVIGGSVFPTPDAGGPSASGSAGGPGSPARG